MGGVEKISKFNFALHHHVCRLVNWLDKLKQFWKQSAWYMMWIESAHNCKNDTLKVSRLEILDINWDTVGDAIPNFNKEEMKTRKNCTNSFVISNPFVISQNLAWLTKAKYSRYFQIKKTLFRSLNSSAFTVYFDLISEVTSSRQRAKNLRVIKITRQRILGRTIGGKISWASLLLEEKKCREKNLEWILLKYFLHIFLSTQPPPRV